MSVWFHCLSAISIRLLLILYGEYHDKYFAVKYTDIDYQVFTDAARYLAEGKSPYNRHTFRYTPLLAYLMIPNILLCSFFGKLLFSFVDVLVGLLIYAYFNETKHFRQKSLLCANMWWYNPLSIAISTRGSAESLMSFASVATLLLLKKRKICLSALVYGFSVHFKLYTIIYSLPLYLSLCSSGARFFGLLRPNRDCLAFAAVSSLCFLFPTVMFQFLYHPDYLNEAILHHVGRKDVRHNFSPYFYLLYLTDDWSDLWCLSLLTFVPQLAMLIFLGVHLGKKKDLALCLFLQTFIFVAFNKVCTSQYFMWFLCFLPLIVPNLGFSWQTWAVLALEWILGQGIWLLVAYLLEFQGLNTFLYIWLSSLIFLFVNVHISQKILTSYRHICLKNKIY